VLNVLSLRILHLFTTMLQHVPKTIPNPNTKCNSNPTDPNIIPDMLKDANNTNNHNNSNHRH